jgi:hypothetical protein
MRCVWFTSMKLGANRRENITPCWLNRFTRDSGSKPQNTASISLKRDWYDLTNLVITVFALFGLWYYACWAGVQGVANKESADAAVGASRAWMVPTGPTIAREGSDIRLSFTNGGKTPAVHLSGTVEYEMEGEKWPAFEKGCGHLKAHPGSISVTYSLMLPNPDPNPKPDATKPFTVGGFTDGGVPAAWQKPLTGPYQRQDMWIHGCIWYTDVLTNKERTTEFMYLASKIQFDLNGPRVRVDPSPWHPKGSRELRDALIFAEHL